jgi:hypothetical protein
MLPKRIRIRIVILRGPEGKPVVSNSAQIVPLGKNSRDLSFSMRVAKVEEIVNSAQAVRARVAQSRGQS